MASWPRCLARWATYAQRRARSPEAAGVCRYLNKKQMPQPRLARGTTPRSRRTNIIFYLLKVKNYKKFKAVLLNNVNDIALDQGFRYINGVIKSYEQTKKGLSYVYCTRRVLGDGISTIPFNNRRITRSGQSHWPNLNSPESRLGRRRADRDRTMSTPPT
jgi:hypothetical protein